MEKSEKQRVKLEKANKTVSQLLQVREERDTLAQEKAHLMEAKESYHTRTSELSERVKILMVRRDN